MNAMPQETGNHFAPVLESTRPAPDREASVDTLTSPRVYGRYRVLRKVGAGGMGAVYLALDTELGREVALKVPRLDDNPDPEILERFQREARTAATIQHPDVCPIFDVGQSGNTPYLVMPFLEGTSLADLVGENNPWPARKAMDLVRRLAQTLDHVHGLGLVHRDLKPSNVMVRPDGSPIILDLGLTRSFVESKHWLTSFGRAMGSPSYMSPEQVKGDLHAQGPCTDIYALGVILYQLLTGHLPFVGPLYVVYGQILFGTTRPPSSFRAELGLAEDDLCLRAMARQVQDRYSSMAEFVAHLEQYQQPASPWLSTLHTSAPGSVKQSASVSAVPTVATILLEDSLPPRLVNSLGMEFVLLPPGKFLMGSSREEQQNLLGILGESIPPEWLLAEGPRHEVEITRPFYMGVYPVTQEQYEKVMGTNPSHFCATRGGCGKVRGLDTRQFPVEDVSWEDALTFCKRLSNVSEERLAARGYRLPTEAEWEYACREGNSCGDPFHHGKTLTSFQANFNGGFPYGTAAKGPDLQRTTRVGSYPPNRLGLYDMHGNVWEWCADWYHKDYYQHSPRKDPQGPTSGTLRVLRGGSWDYAGRLCRTAYRAGFPPDNSLYNDGFRVVLSCLR